MMRAAGPMANFAESPTMAEHEAGWVGKRPKAKPFSLFYGEIPREFVLYWRDQNLGNTAGGA